MPSTDINPRRMVVEDRALTLAEVLATDGHIVLAARIVDAVPDSFGSCDEHVQMLRERLIAVHDLQSARVDKILAALDDLPAHIGRRGTVWLSWDPEGYYDGHWADADWLEQAPFLTDIEAALIWARTRADQVIVRPSWDESASYSAGDVAAADFPPLVLP